MEEKRTDLKIKFDKGTYETLDHICQELGCGKEVALRNALAMYEFLIERIGEGNMILFTKDDRKYTQLVSGGCLGGYANLHQYRQKP